MPAARTVSGSRWTACTRAQSSIKNWPSSCGSARRRGSKLLVRDPNQARLSSDGCPSCPQVILQGYAQCFENYVADSYAAVDAHDGKGQVPEGPPSRTGPGLQKSATRCCGRRRAESGSASESDATLGTATHGRDVCPIFADEGLGLSEIGGKGQSLARLASAGLPVPNGFHITTAAYHDFIAEHHLEDPIKARLATVSDPASQAIDQAASAIAALITSQRSRPMRRLTSCGPTSGWARRRWPSAPLQPPRTCRSLLCRTAGDLPQRLWS